MKLYTEEERNPCSPHQLSLFGQWGHPIEVERRNRIRLSIAAYAYEFESNPIMDDVAYDKLSYSINTKIATGNSRLDRFFKSNFDPFSGLWIRLHPDLEGIKYLYKRFYVL